MSSGILSKTGTGLREVFSSVSGLATGGALLLAAGNQDLRCLLFAFGVAALHTGVTEGIQRLTSAKDTRVEMNRAYLLSAGLTVGVFGIPVLMAKPGL